MHTKPIKGRGAADNPAGRFAAREVEVAAEEAQPDAPPTEFRAMQAKQIISSNRSPDIPFDRSINPYQGCEHGCIYCYARPSHSYLDLSPGLDFETKHFLQTERGPAPARGEWSKAGRTNAKPDNDRCQHRSVSTGRKKPTRITRAVAGNVAKRISAPGGFTSLPRAISLRVTSISCWRGLRRERRLCRGGYERANRMDATG